MRVPSPPPWFTEPHASAQPARHTSRTLIVAAENRQRLAEDCSSSSRSLQFDGWERRPESYRSPSSMTDTTAAELLIATVVGPAFRSAQLAVMVTIPVYLGVTWTLPTWSAGPSKRLSFPALTTTCAPGTITDTHSPARQTSIATVMLMVPGGDGWDEHAVDPNRVTIKKPNLRALRLVVLDMRQYFFH